MNSLFAYQSGTDNQALVIQEGGARSETSHIGTNNSLSLLQTAWQFGASSAITQSGESNTANVEQTDGGRHPGGRVALPQDGKGNSADAVATGAWSLRWHTAVR